MTDDIVTRLRADARWLEMSAPTDYQDMANVQRQAADEIERLRAELEEARNGREAYGQVIFSLQEQLREYEDD